MIWLFAVFLHKSYIWGKPYPWDMNKNGLSQSDCRIFNSAISSKQISEKASFFSCWYKFTKIKSWSKILQKSLFYNFAGLRPAMLLKTRLWHKCFPVNFVKFLRKPFFLETNSPIIKMNTLHYKTTDKIKAFILYVILKRNLKFYMKSIHFLIEIWFSVFPLFCEWLSCVWWMTLKSI